MIATILSIHALSPIHVGTGQGAGVIDLPLIREAVTGWPYLPGSSIKGILRDACRDHVEEMEDASKREDATKLIKETFGPDNNAGEDPSEHAGGLIFGDQHLLCLPVRSYLGGFAWVTCPFAVNRWLRDQANTGIKNSISSIPSSIVDSESILVPRGTPLPIVHGGRNVYLEDLELRARQLPEKKTGDGVDVPDVVLSLARSIASASISGAGWQALLIEHFGIVSDTTFGFLARTAMEVTARNSIDDRRKIVKDGALWWEESTPTETIFTGPLITTPQGDQRASGGGAAMLGLVRSAIRNRTLQIGGNATIGRGLALARFPQPGGEE